MFININDPKLHIVFLLFSQMEWYARKRDDDEIVEDA
jgi:hypothetical protein